MARADCEAEGAPLPLREPLGEGEGEGAPLPVPSPLPVGAEDADNVLTTDAENEGEPLVLSLAPPVGVTPAVADPAPAVPVTVAQRDSVPVGDALAAVEVVAVCDTEPVTDGLLDTDNAPLRLGVRLADGEALSEEECAPLRLAEGLPVGAPPEPEAPTVAEGAAPLRVPTTLREPAPDREGAAEAVPGFEGVEDMEGDGEGGGEREGEPHAVEVAEASKEADVGPEPVAPTVPV